MDGGKDTKENLVAACEFCNQTRHKMRTVLSPTAYRQHVRRRIAAGKWHPPECHHLLNDTRRSVGSSRQRRTSNKARTPSAIELSNGF
jgi:hypothetical protein